MIRNTLTTTLVKIALVRQGDAMITKIFILEKLRYNGKYN